MIMEAFCNFPGLKIFGRINLPAVAMPISHQGTFGPSCCLTEKFKDKIYTWAVIGTEKKRTGKVSTVEAKNESDNN